MFLLHFQLGVRFRVDLSWSFSAFPLIVSASSDSNKAEPRNSFLAGTQASSGWSGWCVVPVHWRTGCVGLPRPVPTPAQFCSDLCTAHTSSIPPRKHSHPLLAGRKVSQGVLFTDPGSANYDCAPAGGNCDQVNSTSPGGLH